MKNKKTIITIAITIIICLICGILGLLVYFKEDKPVKDKPEKPVEIKKTLTLKIIPNGSIINNTELTCENNGKGCTITLPEIVRDGYTVEGYTDKEDSTKAKYKGLEEITLKDDKTIYALTSKEVKLRIDYPHNPYVSKSVYREDLSCKIYNENTSCKIKLPSDDRDGWKLLGFADDWTSPLYDKKYNGETTKIDYKKGTEIELTKDWDIISQDEKEFEFTLDNMDTFDGKPLTCTFKNNIETCVVAGLLDKIVEKKGYLETNKRTYLTYMNGTNTYEPEFIIENLDTEQYMLGKTTIEIQNTVADKATIKDELRKVYENWPFIFNYRSKIMFLDENTYDEVDKKVGGESAGRTWSGSGNIVIKCYKDSHAIELMYTVVHELGHRMDFYYVDREISSSNKYISNTEESTNLFNKYTTSTEIFLDGSSTSEYAKTNKMEFLAVLLDYYYRVYERGTSILTIENKRMVFPEDLKAYIEKYLN